ncbi:hypothetical protein EVAR_59024_1 [Eumeta japonica]|uniref:Uncharacterized protein n=1 Tax=Eumeta variegata TaxID=151549 RepID=A0A4C1ZHM1_EUMVA|nr:hypothetical protein EVAR_59024_1 [Eumeta japonica]
MRKFLLRTGAPAQTAQHSFAIDNSACGSRMSGARHLCIPRTLVLFFFLYLGNYGPPHVSLPATFIAVFLGSVWFGSRVEILAWARARCAGDGGPVAAGRGRARALRKRGSSGRRVECGRPSDAERPSPGAAAARISRPARAPADGDSCLHFSTSRHYRLDTSQFVRTTVARILKPSSITRRR